MRDKIDYINQILTTDIIVTMNVIYYYVIWTDNGRA